MQRSILSASLLLSATLSSQETAVSAPAPTLVVLNKSAASVSLFDVKTLESRNTVQVGSGPHEAAVSPDGGLVVVCNYGEGSTLSVIDMASEKVAKTIELGNYRNPHGIQFLPDGNRVVVTSEASQRLLIVNIESGNVESAIPTRANTSHMVVLSADASMAYVANIGSGSISVIDLEGGDFVGTVQTGAGSEGIAMRPGHAEVWVTNREADTVSVVDTETLQVVQDIECASFPIRVAFTPDGSSALVSCAESGLVAVIDADDRRIVRKIDMNETPVDDNAGLLFAGTDSPAPVGILVQPDGRAAYIANTRADIITVLDLQEWKIARRIRTGKEPDGMAWAAPPIHERP